MGLTISEITEQVREYAKTGKMVTPELVRLMEQYVRENADKHLTADGKQQSFEQLLPYFANFKKAYKEFQSVKDTHGEKKELLEDLQIKIHAVNTEFERTTGERGLDKCLREDVGFLYERIESRKLMEQAETPENPRLISFDHARMLHHRKAVLDRIPSGFEKSLATIGLCFKGLPEEKLTKDTLYGFTGLLDFTGDATPLSQNIPNGKMTDFMSLLLHYFKMLPEYLNGEISGEPFSDAAKGLITAENFKAVTGHDGSVSEQAVVDFIRELKKNGVLDGLADYYLEQEKKENAYLEEDTEYFRSLIEKCRNLFTEDFVKRLTETCGVPDYVGGNEVFSAFIAGLRGFEPSADGKKEKSLGSFIKLVMPVVFNASLDDPGTKEDPDRNLRQLLDIMQQLKHTKQPIAFDEPISAGTYMTLVTDFSKGTVSDGINGIIEDFREEMVFDAARKDFQQEPENEYVDATDKKYTFGDLCRIVFNEDREHEPVFHVRNEWNTKDFNKAGEIHVQKREAIYTGLVRYRQMADFMPIVSRKLLEDQKRINAAPNRAEAQLDQKNRKGEFIISEIINLQTHAYQNGPAVERAYVTSMPELLQSTYRAAEEKKETGKFFDALNSNVCFDERIRDVQEYANNLQAEKEEEVEAPADGSLYFRHAMSEVKAKAKALSCDTIMTAAYSVYTDLIDEYKDEVPQAHFTVPMLRPVLKRMLVDRENPISIEGRIVTDKEIETALDRMVKDGSIRRDKLKKSLLAEIKEEYRMAWQPYWRDWTPEEVQQSRNIVKRLVGYQQSPADEPTDREVDIIIGIPKREILENNYKNLEKGLKRKKYVDAIKKVLGSKPPKSSEKNPNRRALFQLSYMLIKEPAHDFEYGREDWELFARLFENYTKVEAPGEEYELPADKTKSRINVNRYRAAAEAIRELSKTKDFEGVSVKVPTSVAEYEKMKITERDWKNQGFNMGIYDRIGVDFKHFKGMSDHWREETAAVKKKVLEKNSELQEKTLEAIKGNEVTRWKYMDERNPNAEAGLLGKGLERAKALRSLVKLLEDSGYSEIIGRWNRSNPPQEYVYLKSMLRKSDDTLAGIFTIAGDGNGEDRLRQAVNQLVITVRNRTEAAGDELERAYDRVFAGHWTTEVAKVYPEEKSIFLKEIKGLETTGIPGLKTDLMSAVQSELLPKLTRYTTAEAPVEIAGKERDLFEALLSDLDKSWQELLFAASHDYAIENRYLDEFLEKALRADSVIRLNVTPDNCEKYDMGKLMEAIARGICRVTGRELPDLNTGVLDENRVISMHIKQNSQPGDDKSLRQYCINRNEARSRLSGPLKSYLESHEELGSLNEKLHEAVDHAPLLLLDGKLPEEEAWEHLDPTTKGYFSGLYQELRGNISREKEEAEHNIPNENKPEKSAVFTGETTVPENNTGVIGETTVPENNTGVIGETAVPENTENGNRSASENAEQPEKSNSIAEEEKVIPENSSQKVSDGTAVFTGETTAPENTVEFAGETTVPENSAPEREELAKRELSAYRAVIENLTNAGVRTLYEDVYGLGEDENYRTFLNNTSLSDNALRDVFADDKKRQALFGNLNGVLTFTVSRMNSRTPEGKRLKASVLKGLAELEGENAAKEIGDGIEKARKDFAIVTGKRIDSRQGKVPELQIVDSRFGESVETVLSGLKTAVSGLKPPMGNTDAALYERLLGEAERYGKLLVASAAPKNSFALYKNEVKSFCEALTAAGALLSLYESPENMKEPGTHEVISRIPYLNDALSGSGGFYNSGKERRLDVLPNVSWECNGLSEQLELFHSVLNENRKAIIGNEISSGCGLWSRSRVAAVRVLSDYVAEYNGRNQDKLSFEAGPHEEFNDAIRRCLLGDCYPDNIKGIDRLTKAYFQASYDLLDQYYNVENSISQNYETAELRKNAEQLRKSFSDLLDLRHFVINAFRAGLIGSARRNNVLEPEGVKLLGSLGLTVPKDCYENKLEELLNDEVKKARDLKYKLSNLGEKRLTGEEAEMFFSGLWNESLAGNLRVIFGPEQAIGERENSVPEVKADAKPENSVPEMKSNAEPEVKQEENINIIEEEEEEIPEQENAAEDGKAVSGAEDISGAENLSGAEDMVVAFEGETVEPENQEEPKQDASENAKQQEPEKESASDRECRAYRQIFDGISGAGLRIFYEQVYGKEAWDAAARELFGTKQDVRTALADEEKRGTVIGNLNKYLVFTVQRMDRRTDEGEALKNTIMDGLRMLEGPDAAKEIEDHIESGRRDFAIIAGAGDDKAASGNKREKNKAKANKERTINEPELAKKINQTLKKLDQIGARIEMSGSDRDLYNGILAEAKHYGTLIAASAEPGSTFAVYKDEARKFCEALTAAGALIELCENPYNADQLEKAQVDQPEKENAGQLGIESLLASLDDLTGSISVSGSLYDYGENRRLDRLDDIGSCGARLYRRITELTTARGAENIARLNHDILSDFRHWSENRRKASELLRSYVEERKQSGTEMPEFDAERHGNFTERIRLHMVASDPLETEGMDGITGPYFQRFYDASDNYFRFETNFSERFDDEELRRKAAALRSAFPKLLGDRIAALQTIRILLGENARLNDGGLEQKGAIIVSNFGINAAAGMKAAELENALEEEIRKTEKLKEKLAAFGNKPLTGNEAETVFDGLWNGDLKTNMRKVYTDRSAVKQNGKPEENAAGNREEVQVPPAEELGPAEAGNAAVQGQNEALNAGVPGEDRAVNPEEREKEERINAVGVMDMDLPDIAPCVNEALRANMLQAVREDPDRVTLSDSLNPKGLLREMDNTHRTSLGVTRKNSDHYQRVLMTLARIDILESKLKKHEPQVTRKELLDHYKVLRAYSLDYMNVRSPQYDDGKARYKLVTRAYLLACDKIDTVSNSIKADIRNGIYEEKGGPKPEVLLERESDPNIRKIIADGITARKNLTEKALLDRNYLKSEQGKSDILSLSLYEYTKNVIWWKHFPDRIPAEYDTEEKRNRLDRHYESLKNPNCRANFARNRTAKAAMEFFGSQVKVNRLLYAGNEDILKAFGPQANAGNGHARGQGNNVRPQNNPQNANGGQENNPQNGNGGPENNL